MNVLESVIGVDKAILVLSDEPILKKVVKQPSCIFTVRQILLMLLNLLRHLGMLLQLLLDLCFLERLLLLLFLYLLLAPSPFGAGNDCNFLTR